MSKIAIGLVVPLSTMTSVVAHADGRSVMFLKGVAYGVARECPKLPVDADAIRSTKRISGNAPGDFFDFMDGMTYAARLLKRGEETCDSICGVRPGTCEFVKETPR